MNATLIQIIIVPDPTRNWIHTITVGGVPYYTGNARTASHALDAAAKYLQRKCRVCGCSLLNPCEGGCSWASSTTCSKCADRRRAKKTKS